MHVALGTIEASQLALEKLIFLHLEAVSTVLQVITRDANQIRGVSHADDADDVLV
jgi:hypothetical protein